MRTYIILASLLEIYYIGEVFQSFYHIGQLLWSYGIKAIPIEIASNAGTQALKCRDDQTKMHKSATCAAHAPKFPKLPVGVRERISGTWVFVFFKPSTLVCVMGRDEA